MFKKILTQYIHNSTPFLTTGTTLTSKVIRRASSKQKIQTVGKWDVLSAVCLERHPIITKPMQDIERRYQEMLQQVEFEKSLMSDFEKQMKGKKEQKEKRMPTDVETNVVVDQTIQDFQDMSEQQLKDFKFAPRVNEEEEDRLVSLNRKLDKHLTLVVEQRIADKHFWLPPQSERKDEETMIQAAHRTLQELCGNNVKVKFYGNAPIGFYQYTYPKDVQNTGRAGAKIFYFLAKYISGSISPDVKHCWLDREELRKTVHPNVHKSLSPFMIPD